MDKKLYPAHEILATIPGYVYWKDLDSNYLGCSNGLASVSGLEAPKDIIGRSDYKLPWWKYTDEYRMADQDVFCNNESTVLHNIVLASKTEHVIFTRQTPVRDADGDVVALSGSVTFIEDPSVLANIDLLRRTDAKYFSGLATKQYEIKQYFNGITTREATCLFYLIRGKSRYEIGQRLHISPRTVETHVESLKNKFSCTSQKELIEKAIERGFSSIIPEGVLKSL